MKYRAILSAAALIGTSFTPISFASAALADENSVVTPIQDTTGLTPQEVCDAVLRPADASGFYTYPANEVPGGWVNDGAPVRDQNVGDPVPTGTPTASNVFVSNSYFRNGGSPNVWALAQATLTYPNSTQEYTTIQHQIQTTTFDCVVTKVVGNGENIYPPGLQSTGNSSIEEQDVPGPNGFDTNNGPITLYGQTVHALICISPNNVTKSKPGTWTGKNGFNAANCPAASIAAGGTVPSDNAPDI
jgi:hypothetical protein